jgi:hypothetical protein
VLYELVDELAAAVGRDVVKVLILDRGFIDGAEMGRLWRDRHIETVVPLRANMSLYADATGLTRLPGFAWEPYEAPAPVRRTPAATPKPARIVKREAARQRTLALRKGLPTPAAGPATTPSAPETLLGLARGLTSWSQCLAPLTAVINRERDQRGQTQDWVLVSTSPHRSAASIRATYDLRTAIEERHRQYKCFWDLTRMHSCAFSLVVNQALFVLLAYTLVQAHFMLRKREELNRGVWARARLLLSPTFEVVAVYYRQRFCLLTLAEYGRILLDIVEPARGKLRDRLRQIEREQYCLLETTRPP